jgi:hypothetical protein
MNKRAHSKVATTMLQDLYPRVNEKYVQKGNFWFSAEGDFIGGTNVQIVVLWGLGLGAAGGVLMAGLCWLIGNG